MKRKALKISVAVLAVAVVISFMAVKRDDGWTCSYTGSHKGYTMWCRVIRTSSYVEASALETWMRENGLPVEHNWIRTCGTTRTLFYVMRSHAQAPEIMGFYSLKDYILISSQAEIEELIRVFREEDRETQEMFIKLARQKIEDAISGN